MARCLRRRQCQPSQAGCGNDHADLGRVGCARCSSLSISQVPLATTRADTGRVGCARCCSLSISQAPLATTHTDIGRVGCARCSFLNRVCTRGCFFNCALDDAFKCALEDGIESHSCWGRRQHSCSPIAHLASGHSLIMRRHQSRHNTAGPSSQSNARTTPGTLSTAPAHSISKVTAS
jgi:hypothetical protein